jgi:hypothetical protein
MAHEVDEPPEEAANADFHYEGIGQDWSESSSLKMRLISGGEMLRPADLATSIEPSHQDCLAKNMDVLVDPCQRYGQSALLNSQLCVEHAQLF